MTANPDDRPQSASSTPWWRSQGENIRLIIIALVIAFVLRTFVAEPRYIPSDSMLPTLEQGDRLLVEKVSYYIQPPQRGDVIVFHPPEQLQRLGYQREQAFIKRVIAQSGDRVQVLNGRLYLNGEPQLEPYIAEPPQYQWGPATVPPGRLMVMGDNRNNSNDSHIWGFLPVENVIGRAVIRFWPVDRLGGLSISVEPFVDLGDRPS
ncbi:signal peptidase I [Phormidium yuhuli AB48]|uniref:Signal peptidase I n=1 Tax=Phormidium yuhuli AB48 TaxID=2940671 RepID=A0ABY5ASA5_9CYAN|nr:signal peptidase I [Phormidium yuhuli]USR91910.1 signal peptidase I [Phormidium yuhuli AB48]